MRRFLVVGGQDSSCDGHTVLVAQCFVAKRFLFVSAWILRVRTRLVEDGGGGADVSVCFHTVTIRVPYGKLLAWV